MRFPECMRTRDRRSLLYRQRTASGKRTFERDMGVRACRNAAGPHKFVSERSMTVLQQIVVAQIPVLPQLQCAEQHDEDAERGMPKQHQAVIGVAEDRRRSDQPEAEQDFGYLLPALQRDIFEL